MTFIEQFEELQKTIDNLKSEIYIVLNLGKVIDWIDKKANRPRWH